MIKILFERLKVNEQEQVLAGTGEITETKPGPHCIQTHLKDCDPPPTHIEPKPK